MRQLILKLIVAGFIVLGAIDLSKGNIKTGIATILLGIVNGLLISEAR